MRPSPPLRSRALPLPAAIAAFALGVVGLSGLGIAAVRAGTASAETAVAPPAPAQAPSTATAATPVLVELFTSEGCSSCPPADAALERLVHANANAKQPTDVRPIAIAHHVDYWNDLGWPDPFSSAEATARQQAYARLGGGTYTPQAVVDGSAQLVGSRGGQLEALVAAAAKRLHVPVYVTVAPAAAGTAGTVDKGAYDVGVRVGALPGGSATDAEIVLAVVQDRGRVAVPRGENSGLTLDHIAIARSVKLLGAAGAATSAPARSTVHVPAAISAPNGTTFSVVAFVQERASRHVLGSAMAPLM